MMSVFSFRLDPLLPLLPIALWSLLPVVASGAGPGSGTGLGALSPEPARLSVGPGVSYAFPGSLKRGDPGDVSVVRYAVEASYSVPAAPGSFLTLTGGYEYADYDWSDADLFDESHRLNASAIGLRRLGESKWGLFGFGRVEWGAERAGDLGRGFSATAIVGPAYSFSRDLSVTVGVLTSVQPERSTRAFPVAALNWRIDPQWSLRTLNGAILTYTPEASSKVAVDFFAEYRTRGIRLREQVLPDNSIGRQAVEEREIAAGIGATWLLRENLVLQGFAEYLFERKWRFREDKTDIRTVEAKAVPQIGLRLSYAL